jgi:hypothetical protein
MCCSADSRAGRRRRIARAAGLTALLWALATPAGAHEFRTAYLQVRETAADRYSLSWRAPATRATEHRVQLRAAPGCRLQPLRSTALETLRVEDYALDCSSAGAQAWIELHGLEQLPYDALVHLQGAQGAERQLHLHGAQQRFVLQPAAATDAAPGGLLRQGFAHVLGGYDHLAYMLLLYLFLRRHWTQLLLGVTGFTLAHSVSLALSALGVLRLPVRPVEAVIALTICYFALALVHRRQAAPGSAWRWQAVILFCGLVHGLGFANSLDQLGFDRGQLLWGLASFNFGIELAQLLLILTAAVLFRLARRLPGLPRLPLERALATGVGAVGAFWYLQRVFS